MVDTSELIQETIKLIERGKYFVMNRPRQYGKTTSLYLIKQELMKKEDYLPIKLSFEGIGDSPFESRENFCSFFLQYLGQDFYLKERGLGHLFSSRASQVYDFESLSRALSDALLESGKKVVLMIDEVDKSSNNEIFVHFLGMLRNKYLNAQEGEDATFYSVVLAGVHDVKTLKLKLRPDDDKKLNSPWNIATDYFLDMSFNAFKIESMLKQYVLETKVSMDTEMISKRIYFWTNGYPFLVSKICKMMEENVLPQKEIKEWTSLDIDYTVKKLLSESNTLFDDMIKNIENNEKLFLFVQSIVLGCENWNFTISEKIINLAFIYGLISNKDGKAVISNKIFEEYLTNHIVARMKMEKLDDQVGRDAIQDRFLKPEGRLDMKAVLLKFQEVIQEKYSQTDLLKSDEFLEKDLRLLFFVFLKPIINGIGFSFKEVEIGAEKRLDVVVVFKDEKFIIELKVWYGQKYHDEGKRRLKKYMEGEFVDKGYMLIMDKRRSKEFSSEVEDDIFMVWI